MNMHALMRKDRSIRKFQQKAIPDDDLNEILENVPVPRLRRYQE